MGLIGNKGEDKMYQMIAIGCIWLGVGLCGKNDNVGLVVIGATISTMFICMTIPIGG